MQRPTEVTVLAILHLAFGVFGLCGVLMAVAMLAAPDLDFAALGGSAMAEMQKLPAWKTFNAINLPLGTIAVICQLVCAAGMLNLRPWSRKGMLGVAGYQCLSAIVSAVFMFFCIALPLVEMTKNAPPAERLGAQSMLFTAPMSAIFGLILPFVTIWLLNRKNVVEAFLGIQPPSANLAPRPYRDTGNPYQSP
ncbi:MAG: hypothetical protein AB7O62_23325 [Pirellulales bacterium]